MTFFDPLNPNHFGYPGGWYGTSMAAPHVAAAAAMVIASGVIGPPPEARRHPQPARADRRSRSAPASRTPYYGYGLVDAGAATTPSPASAARRPPVAAAQVVRTTSTEHGAWWETLFGTEPSRNRLAPVIPLLPTTIRSARLSSAMSMIASAASP